MILGNYFDFSQMRSFWKDRGEMGYIIQPKQKHGFLLTAEEMHLVLAIYEELIRRKEDSTLTENSKNC